MLRGLRAYFLNHIFDTLYVIGVCFPALLFVFYPRLVVGSNPSQPEPEYSGLFPIPGDTTLTPPGQPPGNGAGTPGNGQFNPNKFFNPSDTTKPFGQSDTTRKDSTGFSQKKVIDSTYVVCLDSSARLEQFTYVRKDHPQVQFFPDRTYPLFAAGRPASFQRQATLDSSGNEFLFSETVGGGHVKIPLTLSFDEYIALRRKDELRKMLAEEARKPIAAGERNDLGELLSNITKITIPVPHNPLFSIFGKDLISLNISGAVDIKAGFRNTKSDQTQISSLDQSRNEPDFQQEVQVNVNGMIGDKLSILADWNTQRTFEYENQLKIKYTGYDDEIVQSVEAGNVSLTTPSSFIGSSQALFGIKAKFQTGPLTLTTLASQKKGQIKEVSVSGGAQDLPFGPGGQGIQPYDYTTNYYFVDTSYRRYYEPYYNNEPPSITPEVQLVDEEVWVQRQGSIPDPNERQGKAIINLGPRGSGYPDSVRNKLESPGSVEVSGFVKLDRSQFEVVGDGYIGVIALNTNVQDNLVIGVTYRTAGGNGLPPQQFGEFARDTTGTLILKMLKPRNLQSVGRGYPVAWNQMLKNIYSLGGRNIKQEGFVLDIVRQDAAQQGQNTLLGERLLRVLGLDRFSPDGTPAPNGDNLFDFRPGRTINQARAEVIFPSLRPFDDGMRAYFESIHNPIPDSLLFPQIYDTTKTFAQQSTSNKYVIQGKATGEATSKFNLGFNIVEGSVQVLLDGRQLAPNVDYTVDYIVGEVVIRNDRALVPGANMQIKYEQNDLFQLASKTLLGARGDLAVSQNTNLGFTIMNLNQQTLSDKVRLGEEPNKNTILGFDGQTQFDLPFLSSAINALPMLETREPSSIKIAGEAAYMIPDPNTMKSTIPSDNGASIAYIDDFEGARRTIPFGISYAQWYQASPPSDEIAYSTISSEDTTEMFSKGKTIWYNILPTNVTLTEIYPNKKPGNASNDQATVLDIDYSPLTRGMYNLGGNLANTLTATKNWGGIMKPISISATNLINENMNYIEIWMQINNPPRNSDGSIPKMRIDLGTISEDAIPDSHKTWDGHLNSEDLVHGQSPNGTLQDGEDIGLDMMNDGEEVAYVDQRYGNHIGFDAGDPSGDDYSFDNTRNQTPQDFAHINGTENSRNSPSGLIPDTEDLNSNGQTDRINQYMEYEIPLDTNRATNPFIVGGGFNSAKWFQFRIPIREYTRLVGTTVPNLENVESVRISFLNASGEIHVRIADMGLVGNQWQVPTSDTTNFAVSVVSVEDNPDYTIPPGVARERDKTQPDQDIQANEQSLALLLNQVPAGQSRQAVKFYTFKPLDVFSYRQMKMFVHGDLSFGTLPVPPQSFFRFGYDSLNYYEYRGPIYPGWDQRNEININFQELTAIKQLRDSINQSVSKVVRVEGTDTVWYRVVGNPSLTQVRYLALGVTNREPPVVRGNVEHGRPLSGQVWFNELRLTDVDDSPGWAYRVDTQLKLADLGTVSFNYSKVDPNFHTLEQRFGSRQTGINWALNASMSFEKFFPTSWVGTSLPFSYSRSVNLIQPKYLPNSDVLVDEAAALAQSPDEANAIRTESETYRVTDTYAAPNFKIGLPSQAWYIRDTFNKLAFGFNFTRSSERSPATVSRISWSWNAKISYALNLSTDYYVQPFKDLFAGVWFLDEYKDVKLYYTPSNFSWSLSAVRSRDNTLQLVQNAQQTITRNFTASRQFGFGWKLTEGGLSNLSGTYSLSVESSLLDLETDRFGQRSFSKILNDIFFGDKLINFGTDTRYSQQNQFSSRPNIPNIFNIKKYLDLSMSYSVDYAWQNTLVQGDLGKSAGWNNNISVTTNFKLKQLFDPLFEENSRPGQPAEPPRGGESRGRGERQGEPGEGGGPPKQIEQPADTTAKAGPPARSRTLDQLKNLARLLIKIPFLDYENINVTFTQTNNAANSGVVGRTGFVNFWGRAPFFQDPDINAGPSRMYQLGLISDPSGRLGKFGFRPAFPFFGWGETQPGLRAPLGQLQNTFRQQNRVALKSSRNLWEGARVDLNWSIGWAYSRTQNLATDSLGIPAITNVATSGSVERSYLSFPDVFFLGIFKSSLKDVSKLYSDLKHNRDSTVSNDEKLAQAFEQGFEALPFLNKIFGQYYPRVNWSLRWDGLEKFPMFAGFATRVSLEHAYSSTYNRQFENRPGETSERTTGQRVTYGFAPLIGLNLTFKELLKGSFGANLRYNSNTSYDLSTSSENIVEQLAQEISITANYSRRGFEIPFFGLSLNNDLDISASYSVTKNSRTNYNIAKLDVNTTGEPQDGSTRTVLEPRIKYVLSSRVTASVYYRYTKIEPDASGSRIPGSTVNEAGLDIHIAIQ